MDNFRKIAGPRVHMNGTSKQELEAQLEEAMRAIDAATNAVVKAAPHMRDYYTYFDQMQTYYKARDKFTERLTQLNTMHADLMDIYYDIENQGRE